MQTWELRKLCKKTFVCLFVILLCISPTPSSQRNLGEKKLSLKSVLRPFTDTGAVERHHHLCHDLFGGDHMMTIIIKDVQDDHNVLLLAVLISLSEQQLR